MSQSGDLRDYTMPVDTAVVAGTILVFSGVNQGSAAQSTAKQLGFIGVAIDGADAKGYSPVRGAAGAIAKVRVGAVAVVPGFIAADVNGLGKQFVQGTDTGQYIGIALGASPAGGLVDVILSPGIR